MIYYVRHGQSEANVKNIFSDPYAQLTETGIKQAHDAGEKIKNDGIIIDNIISSTYDRTSDTAKIIANEIGFDENQIKYDPRLVEYNAGELIGKSEDGKTAQQVINAKGAENLDSMNQRIQSALAEIRLLTGNSLIIGHAGVGRVITAVKQGLDPRDFYNVPTFPNGQIIVLE